MMSKKYSPRSTAGGHTILGIDPGTSRVGYGVITVRGGSMRKIESGLLHLSSSPGPARFSEIAKAVELLVTHFGPNCVGVETVFFSKNKKTAISVAHARGAILTALANKGVSVLEINPATVKMGVTGHGSASKTAVARLVGVHLGVSTEDLLDDETDALAIAIATASHMTPL